jgi:DNA polymerase III gamma/tau subunit
MSESEAVELYRKHRPTKFSEIVGQDEAVAQLVDMGKRKAIPHFLLFTGPSGCGKTTLARILRNKLKCSDTDFNEINAANERGIDMVRDIQNRMGYAPMGGKCRMWLCDEAHQLTSAAQGSFLKILEDTDSWVYFIFCTTDPQKLKKTIRTRATTINLKSVRPDDMSKLIQRISKAENKTVNEDVIDKIVELAEGSPRQALVLYSQVFGLDSDSQLDVLKSNVPEKEGIDLARALLGGKSSWASVVKVLNGIDDLNEKAENIRWIVMGYASSMALKNPRNADRAVHVIDCFAEPYFNTKKAGLISSCFDAMSSDS